MKLSVWLVLLIAQMSAANLTVAAEPIGRLFSTPNERAYLEDLRKIKKKTPELIDEPIGVIEAPAPVRLPDQISMQGYVKRNDGKRGTVWINGNAVQENSRTKDIQVGRLPIQSNRVPMRLPANGKRITLKAGQVYDPQTNKVREIRRSVQGDVGRIGNESFP